MYWTITQKKLFFCFCKLLFFLHNSAFYSIGTVIVYNGSTRCEYPFKTNILFSVSPFLYVWKLLEFCRWRTLCSHKSEKHLSWLSIFFIFWYWAIVDYASFDFAIVAAGKAYNLIVTMPALINFQITCTWSRDYANESREKSLGRAVD